MPTEESGGCEALLSVVVCTRNRRDSLQRTLQSFERIQTEVPWEIVVVDNGSGDGTSALLSQWEPGSLPLRHISQPEPGLSKAKNAGVAAARGSIVCFTDDDCYPDPSYVDAWISVFSGPYSPDFCGGRIELFDLRDVPETIKTDREPMYFPPFSFIPPGSMHGASMAFRRSVLAQVGLFDKRLGPGTPLCAAEDADYLQRASLSGFAGRYDPTPLVWHHHGRKIGDLARLHKCYQIGKGAFYAKLATTAPRATVNYIVSDMKTSPSFLMYCKRTWWRLRKQKPSHLGYNLLGFFGYLATVTRDSLFLTSLDFVVILATFPDVDKKTTLFGPSPASLHKAVRHRVACLLLNRSC